MKSQILKDFDSKLFWETLIEILWSGLPMVLVCVAFAALVAIIEASYHMRLVVQTDALVPGITALLVVREMAVVVPALLITARSGAGMAGSLALLNITDQVAAYRLLGVSIWQRFVWPRLCAWWLALLSVTIMSTALALGTLLWVGAIRMGFTPYVAIQLIQKFVTVEDLVTSLIKASVFAWFVPLIAAVCGLACAGGAVEVGRATTKSVVLGSLAVIFADFLLSWLVSSLY